MPASIRAKPSIYFALADFAKAREEKTLHQHPSIIFFLTPSRLPTFPPSHRLSHPSFFPREMPKASGVDFSGVGILFHPSPVPPVV